MLEQFSLHATLVTLDLSCWCSLAMHTVPRRSSLLASATTIAVLTGATCTIATAPPPAAYPQGPPPASVYSASGTDQSQQAAASPAPGLPPERARMTWRSYDATLQPAPPATIAPQGGGRVAVLELYESADNNGVQPGGRLDEFIAAAHFEAFNNAERYWTVRRPTANRGYPYAGKSTIGRGADAGEANAAPPLGVRDLQLHPPQSDHLMVAAFVVPITGDYGLSDLAARRVSSSGGTVRYIVLAPSRAVVSTLRAGTDRAWVRDPGQYPLGQLRAGDRIYFAVDRDGDYGWDATEISFSVSLL